MSAASAVVLNAKKYGSLFAASVPQEITNDTENEARIQELEALSFAEELTPEEEAYSRVLAILIKNYEQRYTLERTLDPVQTLKLLMSNSNLGQSDLVPVIDSKSHISEILKGTRGLSKLHISRLSEFFRVSPEVFFPLSTNK